MSAHVAPPAPVPFFWRSARGRALIVLVAAAVLLSAAAAAALVLDTRRTSAQFKPETLFPGLDAKLAQVASLTIANRQTSTTVARQAGEQWVVPAASGYPASAEHVRELLLGVSELKAVERKTARPDWLETLDLVAPDKGGAATLVTLADAQGAPIASLLVGKQRAGGLEGRDAFYVRRANEDQAYLAEGNLPLEPAIKNWLEESVIDLGRDRVRRVVVSPQGQPSYAVSRATAEQPNFLVEAIPAGRAMQTETVANAIGAGAVAITLEAVRPVGEVDFARPSRIVFETFDGLSLAIDLVDQGEQSWIKLAASAAPGSEAAREAEGLNARLSAWAFAVPSWKATLFRRTLESLLKSPTEAAAPAPTP